MEFLRFKNNSTANYQYIPDNYVVRIHVAADTLDAGSNYSAPKVIRGKIIGVHYLFAANGLVPSIVDTGVLPAYNGSNALYEYGCHT